MCLFLVHLSRRLKCTIVITRRPSVRPSVRRPSLTFHIFDFSSETAEWNSTKQDLNVLYQSLCFSGRSEKQDGRRALWWAETFSTSPLKPLNGIQQNLTGSKISMSSTTFCVFRADRKNKMAALGYDWLRHFRLLLWNCWMKFNETWQEARSQRPLPSLCFSGRSEKQDGRPGLWLAETFSTSPLKPLNEIQRNLTGSKISTSSTKFVFFGLIEKQDCRPALWLAETFSTSPLKPLNGIQWNLTGSKISMSSTKFVFLGPIGKTRWPPWPLIGWDIFDFSDETTEWNSTKLDRK